MFEVFQAAYSHRHATRAVTDGETVTDACVRVATELAQHRPSKPIAGDDGPVWRPCSFRFYSNRFCKSLLACVYLDAHGFVYVASPVEIRAVHS